ncbi:MAG: MG2 domain-containing protein [Myxococcota bacterium]|nr:MG2 domain-containing protein [Myxococcota bacterium]
MRWPTSVRGVVFSSLLGLVVGTGAGCGSDGSTAPRELKVLAYSPEGSVDGSELITIRFDKPVVDEALVSTPVAPGTVEVTPDFAHKGYWQDTRTIVIDPVDHLASSTRYRVALAGELGKRTSGFHFSFVHDPLAVDGVWGIDPDMLALAGELPVSFNQPVRPADAAKHCKLVGAGGDLALVLATAATEPVTSVALVPAKPMQPAASYTLTCASLTGAGGNTPLAAPYALAVRARPPLAVTSITPTGRDVPADEATLTFTFTTPVALEVVRKAITSSPRISGLDAGYLSGDGTVYTVTADLDTETDYRVKISKLTDTFGQQLAKPHVHELRTGNALPRLSMERGIFALEASAKGYPLWSRNVGKFELECAAIPRDRIVQVLTTDMNYDPWGGNDDDKPIDWKALKVKAKTRTLQTSGKNKWRLNELALGSLCGAAASTEPRGVYLAEVRSDEVVADASHYWSSRQNRVLANVTDLGVLIKTGTASGLVWVTSLATGAPVAGAKVTIYTPQGKAVHTDLTTVDGIVKVPGSVLLKQQRPTPDAEEEYEDWDSYRSQRLIAIVEKEGDTAVVDGNWANGIQLWNFGVPEDRRGGVTKIRGFIQSDRGLYRPGELVQFKGIAREIAHGKPPRVPAKATVKLDITDSRGASVLATRVKLTEFGGFAFELPLGADAALGDYYVTATIADQDFREKFSVEEFRPATFELKLASRRASPRPGERLTFDLDARYLFGSAVDGARVEWGLRRRDHVLRFPGFEQYTFSANPRHSWWEGEREDYGDFIADGEGTTNANGRLAIAARDSATKLGGPVDYILTTNLTDSADQTIGKSLIVTAHKTSFYLGIHANEYVQAVGMPFGVNLAALAPDGTRIATKAKLSLVRTLWSCAWTDVGHRAFQKCEASEKPLLEREVTLAAAGSHTERIYPTEPGNYVIKVEAKDDRGNAVIAASEVWVIGKGEAFWSGDEGDRMSVVASKPSYLPGETARLVAMANLVKPTALITIERDGIIDARVRKLDSASEGVELTIADAWAPNVFASIALVSGRQGPGDKHRPQFKLGIVKLEVSTAHKQLDVAVSLDRETVRPGDEVKGKIKVTGGGQPVKAEVSLSVADEGVLQLIAYQTPNPMKTFYAAYGLGVDPATNWNRIARLADPEAGDPDSGGDTASARGQQVRSKFVASAYWAPLLVTDERGEIAFSFTAPDNLSAFRLMAVAADISDRFGAGEQRLVVTKPLMAVPALPRFLRTGDSASVGMVIHNSTDVAGTATVTASASGATLDATRRTIQIPARGSARVRFTAKASERATATFQFGVVMGTERDDVKVTLPVERPRVIDHRLLVEKKLGEAQADGMTWAGNLGVGADVLRKESTLTINVDRTGVADLAPSLRSLVEYPYGCLEQTMSKFVPLVAAKDLAKTLDDPSLQGTRARGFIRAGVQKVIRHQQGDGHFSLWPQSQTYPHLTAYALWGLTVAQGAGEKVPDDVFDRGIAAMATWTNSALKPDGEGATAAMAAYVMALRGKPDASLNARLFALRTGLPKFGQPFLLRAMKLAKADAAQVAELQKLIAANVVVRDGKAMVRESMSAADVDHYMTSDVRATAMTLAALLEVDPTSALIDPLVAGLKAERGHGGSWASTQDNLWSLVALAEYGRRSSAGSTTVTITVGGKQVARKKITGGEVATTKLALGAIAADEVRITVDRPAHVSARVTEARVDAGATVADGFSIERRFLTAAGSESTTFRAGELVTVQLVVTADQNRKWVALVDALPAGFEVVNAKLASGGSQLQPAPASPWATRRQRWQHAVTWDHQNLRDDRVEWFADAMAAGTYELTYQARATIDGTFTAMPAVVEAMYAPDKRARTTRTTITVTK